MICVHRRALRPAQRCPHRPVSPCPSLMFTDQATHKTDKKHLTQQPPPSVGREHTPSPASPLLALCGRKLAIDPSIPPPSCLVSRSALFRLLRTTSQPPCLVRFISAGSRVAPTTPPPPPPPPLWFRPPPPVAPPCVRLLAVFCLLSAFSRPSLPPLCSHTPPS